MESLLRDVRLALRRLRMTPGFTFFAVASLAVGVGVSTAVYSAVRTLFWLPLGVPRQEELVVLTSDRITNISGPDFQDVRAQQSGFKALAASARIRTALSSVNGAEVVLGEAVSGDYFAVMHLVALRGRLLTPLDERESSRVVVLSERFWRQHMHGDPAAVGRTIRLGGLPFDVIGVIRGSFHGLDRFASQSAWIPVGTIPANARAAFDVWGDLTTRQAAIFTVWGRLRPDVSPARAAGEVQVIGQRLDAVYPRAKDQPRRYSIREHAATPPESEAINTIAGMIMTGVAVLLLVACSNLANLALAKGTSRSEETAVRSALGASRWRLVREQLVESTIVVAAGGALGVVVLYRLVDYFTIDLPMGRGQTMPLRPDISFDVLAGSAVALLLALLVFGVWPALQATQANVRAGFGSGLAATPPKWRLHRNLVAWQVCGCVALLLVAAMTQRVIGAIGGGLPSAAIGGGDLAIAQVDFALNGRDESQTRRLVDALLAGLRALGSYAKGLELAGGFKLAPNPLCPTVIFAPDPDDTAINWMVGQLVPRISRSGHVVRHTAKMIEIQQSTYTALSSQAHYFVCEDDAAWAQIEQLRQAAQAAADTWEQLLRELGTYQAALADGRYARKGAAVETPFDQEPTVQALDRAIRESDTAALAQIAGVLSTALQDIARRYIGAQRQAGQALLDSARCMHEARQLAQHGEWQTFLEATNTSATQAKRLLDIHRTADENPAFADAVRSDWLRFAVAADLAQESTPAALIDGVLSATARPTRAAVRQVKAEIKSTTVVDLPPAAPAPPHDFDDAARRYARLGWKLEKHGSWWKLTDPDGKHYATSDPTNQLRTLATFEAGAAKRAASESKILELPLELVDRAKRVGLNVWADQMGRGYMTGQDKGATNYTNHATLDDVIAFVASREARDTAPPLIRPMTCTRCGKDSTQITVYPAGVPEYPGRAVTLCSRCIPELLHDRAELARLDQELPKALSDAGYYWHAASPPTIAHNDGWKGGAATVEQALDLARERMQAPLAAAETIAVDEPRRNIRKQQAAVDRAIGNSEWLKAALSCLDLAVALIGDALDDYADLMPDAKYEALARLMREESAVEA